MRVSLTLKPATANSLHSPPKSKSIPILICQSLCACVPEAAGGRGVWESALGGPLLLQDTLLAAESKACARDPNGFAFGGATF